MGRVGSVVNWDNRIISECFGSFADFFSQKVFLHLVHMLNTKIL